MGNTIYASFADPSLAEKAAGALLDHGVRAEDISVVRSHYGDQGATVTSGSEINTANYGVRSDGDNDLKNAGDAAVGEGHAAGHKIAEGGDRLVGGIADAFGADQTAANYRAAADRQSSEAATNASSGRAEFNDAIDRDGSDARYDNVNYAGDAQNSINSDPTSASRNDVVDAGGDTENSAKHGISTTTPADAGAGAVKGTAWGAGIGALAALASLVVPGVGLVVGGGALAAALGGVAASAAAGAVAGGVTGYLKDQGVDDHAAAHYDNTVTSGGAILAVTTPSGDVSEDEARGILEKYGAANVNAYASKGYLA